MALSSNRFTGKFFALLRLIPLTDSHYDTVTIRVVKQWDISIFRQFEHISISASSSYLRFDSVSTCDQSSAIASKYPDHPKTCLLCRGGGSKRTRPEVIGRTTNRASAFVSHRLKANQPKISTFTSIITTFRDT